MNTKHFVTSVHREELSCRTASSPVLSICSSVCQWEIWSDGEGKSCTLYSELGTLPYNQPPTHALGSCRTFCMNLKTEGGRIESFGKFKLFKKFRKSNWTTKSLEWNLPITFSWNGSNKMNRDRVCHYWYIFVLHFLSWIRLL